MAKTIIFCGIFITLTLFFFISCKKSSDTAKCQGTTTSKDYPLPAEQKNWFDSIVGKTSINCTTLIGVSETYSLNIYQSKYSRYIDEDSCIYYWVTTRSLDYRSGMYDYNFDVGFDFYRGEKIPNFNGSIEQDNDRRYFFHDFDSTKKNNIRNDYEYIPDSSKGCCGFLSSYTTQTGDNYTNVYFFKRKTNKFKVYSLCVSQYHGILEFTSDKGITWTFEYK